MNRKQFVIRRAKAYGVPMKAAESRQLSNVVRELTRLISDVKKYKRKPQRRSYPFGAEVADRIYKQEKVLLAVDKFNTERRHGKNLSRARNYLRAALDIAQYNEWDEIIKLLGIVTRFVKLVMRDMK